MRPQVLKKFLTAIMCFSLLFCCGDMLAKKNVRRGRIKKARAAATIYNPQKIVVSKKEKRLYVITDSGDTTMNVLVGIGLNAGQKTKRGDKCTPHGTFKIVSIENSSKWTHDFGDGNGKIAGVYGPWFLRLNVAGFPSIGIHGTHDESSLGTRCSEGCVRLHNDDIKALKAIATRGMRVIIESE